MKKLLLVASVLGLTGCSDIQYGLNNDLNNSDQWKEAGVPYSAAIQCQKNNVSLNAYNRFSSAGISSLDDIAYFNKLFPAGDSQDDKFDPNDQYSAGLKKVYAALEAGEFSKDDLSSLIQKSVYMNERGQINRLGGPSDTPLLYSDEIIESAKKIHSKSETVDEVVVQNIGREQEEYRQKKEREEADRKNEEEAERAAQYQRDVSRFGKDIMDQCNGVVYRPNLSFPIQDPYAFSGKCVGLELPAFMPSNLGMRQWLGPNTLLNTTTVGEMSSTFIINADEHIKLGTPFVAIGVSPTQYQNGFGVLQTAPTFKVLRFY